MSGSGLISNRINRSAVVNWGGDYFATHHNGPLYDLIGPTQADFSPIRPSELDRVTFHANHQAWWPKLGTVIHDWRHARSDIDAVEMCGRFRRLGLTRSFPEIVIYRRRWYLGSFHSDALQLRCLDIRFLDQVAVLFFILHFFSRYLARILRSCGSM